MQGSETTTAAAAASTTLAVVATAAGHAAAYRAPAVAQQSGNRPAAGRYYAVQDPDGGRVPVGLDGGLRVVQQGPDGTEIVEGQQDHTVGVQGDR